MLIADFPKLHSPFKRAMINGAWVVTPEVEDGYEWVFADDNVIACEKLHGTNVSIVVEQGAVVAIYNRTERIPFINKGKRHITEGVLEAWARGYIDTLGDGQHFGELIGEKLHGNPYKIRGHVWVPFARCKTNLAFKSWGKYPKTFESIGEWFKELQPLYCWRAHPKEDAKDPHAGLSFVEGVVFHHADGRMAKLRRDMFDWFKGERHEEER